MKKWFSIMCVFVGVVIASLFAFSTPRAKDNNFYAYSWYGAGKDKGDVHAFLEHYNENCTIFKNKFDTKGHYVWIGKKKIDLRATVKVGENRYPRYLFWMKKNNVASNAKHWSTVGFNVTMIKVPTVHGDVRPLSYSHVRIVGQSLTEKNVSDSFFKSKGKVVDGHRHDFYVCDVTNAWKKFADKDNFSNYLYFHTIAKFFNGSRAITGEYYSLAAWQAAARKLSFEKDGVLEYAEHFNQVYKVKIPKKHKIHYFSMMSEKNGSWPSNEQKHYEEKQGINALRETKDSKGDTSELQTGPIVLLDSARTITKNGKKYYLKGVRVYKVRIVGKKRYHSKRTSFNIPLNFNKNKQFLQNRVTTSNYTKVNHEKNIYFTGIYHYKYDTKGIHKVKGENKGEVGCWTRDKKNNAVTYSELLDYMYGGWGIKSASYDQDVYLLYQPIETAKESVTWKTFSYDDEIKDYKEDGDTGDYGDSTSLSSKISSDGHYHPNISKMKDSKDQYRNHRSEGGINYYLKSGKINYTNKAGKKVTKTFQIDKIWDGKSNNSSNKEALVQAIKDTVGSADVRSKPNGGFITMIPDISKDIKITLNYYQPKTVLDNVAYGRLNEDGNISYHALHLMKKIDPVSTLIHNGEEYVPTNSASVTFPTTDLLFFRSDDVDDDAKISNEIKKLPYDYQIIDKNFYQVTNADKEQIIKNLIKTKSDALFRSDRWQNALRSRIEVLRNWHQEWVPDTTTDTAEDTSSSGSWCLVATYTKEEVRPRAEAEIRQKCDDEAKEIIEREYKVVPAVFDSTKNPYAVASSIVGWHNAKTNTFVKKTDASGLSGIRNYADNEEYQKYCKVSGSTISVAVHAQDSSVAATAIAIYNLGRAKQGSLTVNYHIGYGKKTNLKLTSPSDATWVNVKSYSKAINNKDSQNGATLQLYTDIVKQFPGIIKTDSDVKFSLVPQITSIKGVNNGQPLSKENALSHVFSGIPLNDGQVNGKTNPGITEGTTILASYNNSNAASMLSAVMNEVNDSWCTSHGISKPEQKGSGVYRIDYRYPFVDYFTTKLTWAAKNADDITLDYYYYFKVPDSEVTKTHREDTPIVWDDPKEFIPKDVPDSTPDDGDDDNFIPPETDDDVSVDTSSGSTAITALIEASKVDTDINQDDNGDAGENGCITLPNGYFKDGKYVPNSVQASTRARSYLTKGKILKQNYEIQYRVPVFGVTKYANRNGESHAFKVNLFTYDVGVKAVNYKLEQLSVWYPKTSKLYNYAFPNTNGKTTLPDEYRDYKKDYNVAADLSPDFKDLGVEYSLGKDQFSYYGCDDATKNLDLLNGLSVPAEEIVCSASEVPSTSSAEYVAKFTDTATKAFNQDGVISKFKVCSDVLKFITPGWCEKPGESEDSDSEIQPEKTYTSLTGDGAMYFDSPLNITSVGVAFDSFKTLAIGRASSHTYSPDNSLLAKAYDEFNSSSTAESNSEDVEGEMSDELVEEGDYSEDSKGEQIAYELGEATNSKEAYEILNGADLTSLRVPIAPFCVKDTFLVKDIPIGQSKLNTVDSETVNDENGVPVLAGPSENSHLKVFYKNVLSAGSSEKEDKDDITLETDECTKIILHTPIAIQATLKESGVNPLQLVKEADQTKGMKRIFKSLGDSSRL